MAFGPAVVGEIWFFSLKPDDFPGSSSLGLFLFQAANEKDLMALEVIS